MCIQMTLEEAMVECGHSEPAVSITLEVCAGYAGEQHLHYHAESAAGTMVAMCAYKGRFESANDLMAIWDNVMAWVEGGCRS